MPVHQFGNTIAASSTILAAPAPTTTTARLTTTAGFYQQTMVQIKVAGVFERVMLYTINVGTGDITFSPLSAPPDTGVGSACEDRGELITNEKLDSFRIAIEGIPVQIQNAVLPISDRFGDGSDGYFYLGGITNPIAPNTPIIAVAAGAVGYINGATVSVKIAAMNMSGETIATVASNIVSVTNGQIDITIPPWASANISAFKIFLSYNGVTYFAAAKAIGDGFNVAAGTTYRLNTSVTSGAAPVGANTTAGGTVNLTGVYNCTYGIIKAGETVASNVPLGSGAPLVILCTYDFKMQGAIQASAAGGTRNHAWYLSNGGAVRFMWGINPTGGTSPWTAGPTAIPEDHLFGQGNWYWLGTQGGSLVNRAGGTVYLAAKRDMVVSGSIFCSADSINGWGSAGGLVCIVGGNSTNIQGCTLTANGGNTTGGTKRGGGGAGIIAVISDKRLGTPAVIQLNGGTGGGGGGAADYGGGAFGGNGGNGATGSNGTTLGAYYQRDLTKTQLPRW